ncbi:unnamed protein product [Urochloa decumbens]|uniref:Knottins-like domain-containing protein n=1 Tax=Urochloa decumbens TaxID=240449 RepID=A0ABC9AZC4_9POAL
MAHSRKNLSAILPLVVLLLVAIATGASASVGDYDLCNNHLSANYKGPCWGWINDSACERVCKEESSNNSSGECYAFQCWCQSRCTSETAAASAPIGQ